MNRIEDMFDIIRERLARGIHMPLPIFTTVEDVRVIVGYLKNKPTGASMEEAKAVLPRSVLDGRKISAYLQWGIVGRDGERLKLQPLGWELARKPDSEPSIMRTVIDSIAPYRSALEWVHHQGFSAVTNVDVASHWHEHHAKAIGTENENTIKDNAVCFFHICEDAGLGKLMMGRNGQPTRLEIDRTALRSFVEAGPGTPPWTATADSPSVDEPNTSEDVNRGDQHEDIPEEHDLAPPPYRALKVFISHGSNMDIVEQIKTMLELADIEHEVAEEEETSAIPVPEKVLTAMRRCGRHYSRDGR